MWYKTLQKRQEYRKKYNKKRISFVVGSSEFNAIDRYAKQTELKPWTFVHNIIKWFLKKKWSYWWLYSKEMKLDIQEMMLIIRSTGNEIIKTTKNDFNVSEQDNFKNIMVLLKNLETTITEFITNKSTNN